MPSSYLRWCHYLFVLSISFAIQGLSWTLMGSFDPFGWYDQFAAEVLYESTLIPQEVEAFKSFIMVPFGATDAAYFVLMAFVIHFPLRQGERWAWTAIATATSLWFVWDTALSIWLGAWFNVWIVNVPCILMIGLGLMGTYQRVGDN